MVGQPTEVVKVRFQAQRRLPGVPLQFTSTPATYRKIGREEGVRGLWKGVLPNIGRNAVVNVAEIVVYDIVKDCLIFYAGMRDDIYCHFSGAVIAGSCALFLIQFNISILIRLICFLHKQKKNTGFAATVAASPIDVVKTRYMNSTKGHYTGAIDCALRMGREEG